jgi:pilus assembly protein CpaB
MNSRAFTLSMVIAGIAMFMVYSYIEGQKNTFVNRYGKESSVVVAKVDINELELMDDTKVTIVKMPQAFLAPGHFKDIKEVFNFYASVPVLKGEQITKPRVTYPGARTGLARQVSNQKRAFSINVDNSQAVSRLIKPGDRVDVVAMIEYGGGRVDLEKVITILQDVLVLSTGISMTNTLPLIEVKGAEKGEYKKINLSSYTDYSAVTLELDPFQVQKIVFLTSRYKPYLSLRNNDDKRIIRIKGTRLFDLLGEDSAEAKSFFSKKEK